MLNKIKKIFTYLKIWFITKVHCSRRKMNISFSAGKPPCVGISIDFGNGVKREYFLTDKHVKALNSGEVIRIETMSPTFGERFVVKHG